MIKKIVIIGAGGHSRVVLSILRYYKQFNIIGIADRHAGTTGERIMGFKIKYTWNDLDNIYKKGARRAIIAVGDNRERKRLFTKLVDMGFNIPTIIHPSAIIEKDAILGDGNVICMGAKIGTNVHIGGNCIIYTGAILDHEVSIGDHVFIAPGCAIAGRVKIGEGAFIGIGSCIKEEVRIGKNAVIGAGSVVLDDVPDGEVVGGIPAKRLKKI